MISRRDGKWLAGQLLDAIAVAGERLDDEKAKLVGVQIMTVWRGSDGQIRIIGVTRERADGRG